MTISVPVIDMSFDATEAGRTRLAHEIDEALHTVGFMAVTGHGVDADLTARMFSTMEEFFALPLEEKRRVAPTDPTSPRGFSQVGDTAQANAHDVTTAPDLVETFNAGLHPIPDTPYHRSAAEFFTPSLWPVAPAGLPELWSAYMTTMQSLAERILASMSEALGLDRAYFAPMIDRPMSSVTVNRYPALDREPSPDQFRGGAHTDYGTITLLATDGVPGLQLHDDAGEWVHVDPVPGAFHVNTGDMLAHWSGGHWRSTWHRVVPPPGQPPYPARTSIAYFHSPNADALISPLPGLDSAAAQDFEPVSAGTYLRGKLDRYYAARSATP
ncbi:isopenicillin N synthase family dioxygenase [Ilumatobacter sp.]|uniref:isopenicillin N synthase family dioxygenase n=1 Tax=Ilumatobacter sp. TaxID=1967498 RepID=UPI003C673573